MPTWTATDLVQLPSAEDESHEYKSSRIQMGDLRREIGVAASGFWNTGGGILVAGVDGSGQPDGGVDLTIGRQVLRDWADQCLADVSPRGQYRVAVITDPSLALPPDRGVLVLAFAESHIAPHMAPDKRYYIRAGAHTVPAPHFVVEALMARRGLTQPLLRPMLRQKAGVGHVVQLGVVAASPAPALDIKIELPAPPPYLARGRTSVSLNVGVIGPAAPFFFDVHLLTMGTDALPAFPVNIEYRDVAGREYTTTFNIDVTSQLGITLAGEPGNREIVRQLDDIETVLKSVGSNVESALKAIGSSIKSNEQYLRQIAGKLR
ncbi:MAG: AlbA family DNA-binding domain-containing protein [Gemmatimonadaceae bacterium]